MSARDDATIRQIEAARPDQSTWLSANAGSGKTRVLTDRVARLLLDGENPQHILCLTYTKAAASEMQNRLFKRLGKWAMQPDDALRASLAAMGYDNTLTPKALRQARRLFALAIETPGGLKIQTIHSFCASMLRRFPLEAQITPQFTEMDEQSSDVLRAEIINKLAEGADAAHLIAVTQFIGDHEFDSVTREIVSKRQLFMNDPSEAALRKALSLPDGMDTEQLIAETFGGGERALLDTLIDVLKKGSINDRKSGVKLAAIKGPDLGALEVLEDIFLNKPKDGPRVAKLGKFPTQASQKALGDLMRPLEEWMSRVERAREIRLAIVTFEQTKALYGFAQAFVRRYEQTKTDRGWLDFDDLIVKARDLLTNPEVAAWVLYRMDGAIDHILLDEAQDTSPVQWQVIELLAQEFTSGQGARSGIRRTIFVVGDKKQSIYSFQGADPREFDRMQQDFSTRLERGGSGLEAMRLEYSFRSSHAILGLVDHCFATAEEAGFESELRHHAFHTDLPGRVDIWPVVEAPDKSEPPPWFMPVDVKASNHPTTVLAEQLAREIKRMITAPESIPDQDSAGGHRAVRPGDFLVLVQRRSALFHEIIRACKEQDLPIAGADRLKVGAELAVRDLLALLTFIDTPHDSLSLAVVLKSPLFGWDEKDLYELAQGREKNLLWEEMETRRTDYPETISVLEDLRAQADFQRPFELIERVLTRHDGRRKLLGRLGHEAEEGIDTLLAQALLYEQGEVDSLTGFLDWMQSDDFEIKRQLDSAGDQIRVMTVHGAKGLESPIVILPDTAKRNVLVRNHILNDSDIALWNSGATQASVAISTRLDALKDKERAERDRLLYVALTRAEKWLIVAAAGDIGKDDSSSWYRKIVAAARTAEARPYDFTEGTGLRLTHGTWIEHSEYHQPEKNPQWPDIPVYLRRPAPQPAPTPKPLSPSGVGGAKALAGEKGLDSEEAKHRGTLIHRLLEYLPQRPRKEWHVVAHHLLPDMPEDFIDDLLNEATQVVTHPDLAALFSRESLAEVPLSACIAEMGGARFHGVIDRLIVTGENVLAVDFKTNAVVPRRVDEIPDGLVKQMAAYAAMLARIYPDHRIETAILWTRHAQLMHIPDLYLKKALCSCHPPSEP